MAGVAAKRARELVIALGEAWNAHDPERVVGFYAADYEGLDVGERSPQHGREGVLRSFARYWQAFPDVRIRLDEMVVQDNRIALVWTASGTHGGSLMSIPSTGRRVGVRGTSLLRLAETQIQHALHVWDVAGLLRAMRLLPDLR